MTIVAAVRIRWRTVLNLARLIWSGDLRVIMRRIRRRVAAGRVRTVCYQAWRDDHVLLSTVEKAAVQRTVNTTSRNSRVAFILTDTANASSTVSSLIRQLDTSWTLHSHGASLLNDDPRIMNSPPRHDPQTWIITLEPGDLVEPTAVAMLRRTISNEHRLVYSDYDHLTSAGDRAYPFFRCGPNVDLLAGHDYLSTFAAVRADQRTSGKSTRQLAHQLLTEEPSSVHHLPYVLFSKRSDASPSSPDPDQPVYGLPHPLPLVSVLVPTRDRGRMLERCLHGVFEKTDYPDIQVVLVDHESMQRRARRVIDRAGERSDCTVIPFHGPFNYAAMMNRAAEAATGSILCLLNNDTEPLHRNWLRALVTQVSRPGIGAVGAHLLFPNGTIQHAGINPGLGGLMGHGHKHVDSNDPGYFGRLLVTHTVAAVTGACLVTSRDTWTMIGGMDEDRLAIAYNDVDYCLRLRSIGLRVVVTPEARLVHHESISRGYDDDPRRRARLEAELNVMKDRWGPELTFDPAYNPNLDFSETGFGIDPNPRVPHPHLFLGE